MQAHQFLRRGQVIAKLGISKTTLYNLEKAGRFPQHFMLTPRCAVWRADEAARVIEGTTVVDETGEDLA